MKFIKDLLFFEIQTTGDDPDKDYIIQLSAILLDKDNLLEKSNYNSYVRVSFLDGVIRDHSGKLHIEFDRLKKSPKIYDAVKQFRQKFEPDLLLATHNITNLLFLRSSFKRAAIKFDYDPHVLELWTLGYIYTLNYGLRKMPTFNTFLDQFRLVQQRPYDSLEKVRLEAEVFRKIIKEA
jgi:DNA polymerase III epsilon subunit-like protein